MLDRPIAKVISFIITTGLFGSLWFLFNVYMPAKGIEINIAGETENEHLWIAFYFMLLPLALTILWSVLKKSMAWLAGGLAFGVYYLFGQMDPVHANPDGFVYLLYVVVAYVACVIAVVLDTDTTFSSGSSSIDTCPYGQCY